jgi:hypothetical protein
MLAGARKHGLARFASTVFFIEPHRSKHASAKTACDLFGTNHARHLYIGRLGAEFNSITEYREQA